MCMEKTMKTIAMFGAFVSDTWRIWCCVFIFTLGGFAVYNKPPTVTLDAKHWECTMAVPDGIYTRCTEYNYKGK